MIITEAGWVVMRFDLNMRYIIYILQINSAQIVIRCIFIEVSCSEELHTISTTLVLSKHARIQTNSLECNLLSVYGSSWQALCENFRIYKLLSHNICIDPNGGDSC